MAEPQQEVANEDDPITFDLGGEDEDDDMADLFSFGSSEATESDNSKSKSNPILSSSSTLRKDADSPDSFLEMLSAETSAVILDGRATTASSSNTANGGTSSAGSGAAVVHDQETQDILDWLDEEDDDGGVIVFQSSLTPPAPVPVEREATVVSLPPSFEDFAQALVSPEATTEQVRTLFVKESSTIELDRKSRQELYCRMVCHKTLSDTTGSSLADSFEQWRNHRSNLDDDDNLNSWLRNLAHGIAQEIEREPIDCENDLTALVLYHEHKKNQNTANTSDNDNKNNKDHLLPPVAAALLATGLPVTAASVILAQMIPNFMPLLALPENERWEASLNLHTEFYLLACYHIPLLVYHLDRYLPGWYWPKKSQRDDADIENISAVALGRNLKKHGQIPPSWLLTNLAGECGENPNSSDTATMLPMSTVLKLWDGILTGQNNASRFFLTLAVLEKHASALLLLTDTELQNSLDSVWSSMDPEFLLEWWPRAQSLESSTPESALARLKHVEDESVQQALQLRQERAEALLQARLEAEAAAHREAQERKAEEARQRLSRARLVAFYRKHAPGKEANIDKIMEVYQDRLHILDAKLCAKYGESFNPAIKPKPPPPKVAPNKLLASVNQRLDRIRSSDGKETVEEEEQRKPDKVSLLVTAEEVLPVVCWSKEATAARGMDNRHKRERVHLKYYLVDSRSEDAAAQQGRFPTAVNLSPEAMMDPERLQQNEDMFESLRGAVHIVIMGEGFNALPKLYNQKLSPKLQELMEQDESRTNLCALFFQKRGFCFISVLDGGFCKGHSWLVREGPQHHLNASAVLVDYNPEATLFGQLETLHNASATEKAQRKMNNLLESSLVTMTKRAQQLERLASDFDTKEGRQGIRIRMFGRTESAAAENSMDTSKSSAGSAGGSSNPETSSKQTTTESAAASAPNPLGKILHGTASNAGESSNSSNPKANRFKGLGAAWKQAAASSTAAVGQKRWSRFGGGGGGVGNNNNKQTDPESPSQRVGGGAGSGFGGFNQFRQNAMSRIRRSDSRSEDEVERFVGGTTNAATTTVAVPAAAAAAKEMQPNKNSDDDGNGGVGSSTSSTEFTLDTSSSTDDNAAAAAPTSKPISDDDTSPPPTSPTGTDTEQK